MKSSRFKKISIIALGVTVLLFLAVLLATPYIMGLTLERWLVSRGPEVGKVKNIDFNPFSGRLSMDGLIVETRGGRTLSISHASLLFSWRQLFKKQLYLKELVLHDAFLLVDRLDESGFRMGGLILNELKGPEKKSDKPGWEVGIASFVLQNAQIAYDTPELEATYYIDQYTLTGLETWNKQKPVQMAYKGRINESRIDVRATVNVLHATKTWKGSIALEDGSLALISKVRGLQQYEPAGSIDIDMQLDARMQEDGSVNFASEGAIVFRDLQLKYEDFAVQQDKIAWQGRMAGNKSAGQQLAGTVEGQLAGAGFALDNQADSMQFLLGMFDWQGKAGVTPQGDSLALTMESELAGEDLHANDEKNKVSLLGLEKFNVSGIQVAGLEDIQVSQAVLQNFRLVEKESIADKNAKGQVPPLLQTAKVEISDARMQNRTDIIIESINFDDVAALVHRSKEGSWQIMPAQHESPERIREQPDPEIADQGAEAGPIRFTINSLQASGSNSIRFEDESLHRPFRLLLHIDELKLNTIGTADTAEPARFAIKGRLGDYGSIAFSGTVNPAQKPIFLDMKGTLGALDMPPFSSYTGRTIGYNVTSGQLDTDYTVKIDKGMMDAIFDLHMRNLEVARV
ncbi:MAG: DUF748 domain-containing protein, partial [Desulfobulbales bacterium]|nr:DUF748 domain-containing protein [Desulfobulbales bacterium]